MVNITPQIMCEGMRADFRDVDALSERLVEWARHTARIRCRTAHGTNFEGEFSPKLKWLKTSGIISSEKWGNLPGGEIFTAPMNTNGTFVVDGVVGDYLCAKYGDLQQTPLTIEVRDNRIADLRCDDKELLEEFRAYTSTDENSNRVGEFAIGTNTACTHVIGNILQDEKIPGIHIAFGHPYSEHTGADWKSKTHIDCVGRDFDIWFDGEPVMRVANLVDLRMAPDLRKRIEEIPFVPFSIQMGDGREYSVPTLDHIYIPPGGARVVVSDDKGIVSLLPSLHISGVVQKPNGA